VSTEASVSREARGVRCLTSCDPPHAAAQSHLARQPSGPVVRVNRMSQSSDARSSADSARPVRQCSVAASWRRGWDMSRPQGPGHGGPTEPHRHHVRPRMAGSGPHAPRRTPERTSGRRRDERCAFPLSAGCTQVAHSPQATGRLAVTTRASLGFGAGFRAAGPGGIPARAGRESRQPSRAAIRVRARPVDRASFRGQPA
jgi:hypothetical protein